MNAGQREYIEFIFGMYTQSTAKKNSMLMKFTQFKVCSQIKY